MLKKIFTKAVLKNDSLNEAIKNLSKQDYNLFYL